MAHVLTTAPVTATRTEQRGLAGRLTKMAGVVAVLGLLAGCYYPGYYGDGYGYGAAYDYPAYDVGVFGVGWGWGPGWYGGWGWRGGWGYGYRGWGWRGGGWRGGGWRGGFGRGFGGGRGWGGGFHRR